MTAAMSHHSCHAADMDMSWMSLYWLAYKYVNYHGTRKGFAIAENIIFPSGDLQARYMTVLSWLPGRKKRALWTSELN